MDELIAFLRARLDEDEQEARDGIAKTTTSRRMIGGQMVTVTTRPPAWRTAAWPPARVLREVDVKRLLLADHMPQRYQHAEVEAWYCDCQCPDGIILGGWPCRTARLLALPYADHPDFQQKWRP